MSRPLIHRLARLRVPLGFLFGGIVLWLAAPTAKTLILGGAIGAVGEGLRVWAAGHISKNREVTTSGPYRWFAHPLYVGSSTIGVGLAIAAGSGVAALCIVAYLVVTLTAAIKSEEAFLRQKFGDEYRQYRDRGRVAVGTDTSAPREGLEGRRFSLERALSNREHHTLAGFLLAVLLLVLKATYNDLLG